MADLTPKGRAFRDILNQIFRVRGRLLESAEQVAGLAGLTTARWQVLASVERTPMPAAHVARSLGLTRQAVQQTVDGMERDELIVFLDNPGHKRARLIALTAKARKALDYLRPRQVQFANLMGSPHTLDALHTTLAVLQAAHATLDARSSSE